MMYRLRRRGKNQSTKEVFCTFRTISFLAAVELTMHDFINQCLDVAKSLRHKSKRMEFNIIWDCLILKKRLPKHMIHTQELVFLKSVTGFRVQNIMGFLSCLLLCQVVLGPKARTNFDYGDQAEDPNAPPEIAPLPPISILDGPIAMVRLDIY